MFGLTTKIRGFVFTRDSAWLLWGKIVGVAGLVTSGLINPAALGLSDKQAKLVMGICGAIAVIAAKLSSSPLPGKADAAKVAAPAVSS